MRPWWNPEKGRHCPDCDIPMFVRAKIGIDRSTKVKYVCFDCGYYVWIQKGNPYRRKHKKKKHAR